MHDWPLKLKIGASGTDFSTPFSTANRVRASRTARASSCARFLAASASRIR